MNEIALRLASRIFDQPLIGNQYRSAFIEAMIEPYLAPFGWSYTGDNWSGWDFERSDGSRLEVKQSAAKQTWSAPRNLQTRGAFDIAARTGYFDDTGFNAISGRSAQTYVFAWNPVYGPDTDHRNPDQWEFYVVPATLLPVGQRTIVLSKIKKLAAPVNLDQLSDAMELATITAPLAPTGPF